MNLSSCRELKARILARAYRAARAAGVRRAYRMRRAKKAARREIEQREPTPVAAVGVARAAGDKRGYRLALRLFRGAGEVEEKLLRGLARYRGEIDVARGVRYAPRLTVRPGGSCGHYRITAGTLGGFVEDDDAYYILSNNHVLANSNCCFEGDPILQPGPSDIAGRSHVIGHLRRWYPLSRRERGGVDAALADFSDAVRYFEPWDYRGIGRIAKNAVEDRFAVRGLIKRGRTTEVTVGQVSAYELDGVAIDYGTPSAPAVVAFDNQIEIIGDPPERAFSAPGDSGSFIIERDTLQAYALLYAGGTDDAGIDRTLAHFLPEVLAALQVRLVQ